MDLQAQIQAAISLALSYPHVLEKLNDALTFLAAAQEREAVAALKASTAAQDMPLTNNQG